MEDRRRKMRSKEPLDAETKTAIRKMIREELRSIEEEQLELEQRVRAAALEELDDYSEGKTPTGIGTPNQRRNI